MASGVGICLRDSSLPIRGANQDYTSQAPWVGVTRFCVCALRLGLGKAWLGGRERVRRRTESCHLLAVVGWAVRPARALGERV